MKVRIKLYSNIGLAVTGLVLIGQVASATAQLLSVSTLRVSVAPRITDGTSNTMATLVRTKDGSIELRVRSFDRRTGFQQGSEFSNGNFPPGQFPSSVTLMDVLVSIVFEPNDPVAGLQHVLVLDSERRIYIFPLAFMSDGTPFLAAPSRVIGPLGPPAAGEATVLGEAPNPRDPENPLLLVGTAIGEIQVGLGDGSSVRFLLGDGSVRFPIQDLGAIPQVGYFAIAAVSTGLLFLVNPDGDPAQVGLQPMLAASLRDPRPLPLIDFSSPVLTRDSEPFIDPLSNLIVTANGSTEVATLEIPPDPQIGSTMIKAGDVVNFSAPVRQVVPGSLTWLTVDGSGVLYNAGFTLEDGIVGRTWTIAGASMEVAPETLNLASGRGFVTVRIEAENNRAAEIDGPTLTLSVDGVNGAVPVSVHPPPTLLNFDGDLNVDLEAKFGRSELSTLLTQTSGSSAVVRASWLYADGTEGTASAQISVKR